MRSPWVIRIETLGASWKVMPKRPIVHLQDGKVVDFTALAAGRGVNLGMDERRVTLLDPTIGRTVLSPEEAVEGGRRVAVAARRLDEKAQPYPPCGAVMQFLPVAPSALEEPWRDAVAALVPRVGFRVQGAASFSPWSAAAILRAAHRGLLRPEHGMRTRGRQGETIGVLWLASVDALPVDCLGPMDASLREALRRRAIERIGDVRALSLAERRALPGGKQMGRLFGEEEKLTAVTGELAVRVHRFTHFFDPPIGDRIGLEAALEIIAHRLEKELLAVREGVRTLAVSVKSESLSFADAHWTVDRRFLRPLPPDRLASVCRRLADSCTLSGPMDRLELHVEGVEISFAQGRLDRTMAPRLSEVEGAAPVSLDPLRLRREERLRFWDPFRATGNQV